MLTRTGIPVSPGVAIGRVFVLDAEDQPIPRRSIAAGQVDAELERLSTAVEKSLDAIKAQREEAEARLGVELAGIFDFHAGLLRDKHLTNQFAQMVSQQRVSAEHAVYTVMRKQATIFRESGGFLKDRVADIWDVERRILSFLIGQASELLGALKSDSVLVAHDLTPSLTASLDRTKIKAIATDAGGRTSHSAIMAHALGIPAVVGLEDVTSACSHGCQIIVDGYTGAVLVDPDASQLMEYRPRVQRFEEAEQARKKQAALPAVTEDGTPVELLANIEFPEEINSAVERGATGIGLYRTEFLFLASATEPSEEEQYEAYRQTIEALEGKPLTIRVFDLGADKVGLGGFTEELSSGEGNPMLGCRGIRLLLQHLPLMTRQLRAILRASVEGPVRIMFPMVSNVMELKQAKMVLQDVMDDLEDEEIPFDRKISVGVMMEVPSAALQARSMAKEVDFFSIGTNDLIQYTVGVDRANERIASLYSAGHPSVLKLIREILAAGKRADIGVSVCGEMAGDPEFTMLLLGLGLRSFSMTPPAIGEVKQVLRAVTVEECEKLARKVRNLDSDREVIGYLRDQVRRIMPEAYD